MRNAHKYIILVLIILLWSCVSVRANEVSVLHLLKDFYANGNPISVEDTTANTLRVMQWDEENRLQSLGDDGYVSRYTYNHAGERVIKSHGPTTVAFVNGAPQGILWHDKDNWTMYVSPYMVVNSDRFTKHYYAGSQRIASKIGAGEFDNLYDASKACVTAGQKDYAERLNLITQSRNDYYAALGIPPGPPTAKGIYGEAEYSGSYGDYTITPLGNYDVPTGWPMKPYKRPYGGTPGAPVMYEKPSDPEDEGAGYGYSNAEELDEKDIYFYHSDHLGSTSYITDANGNATQFVCYKPYGEALVDEHNTSYEQPWKFNGKELDTETGLYYYGARYYEPVLALWYGVDALAEKYPNMGGYVYCANNPIRLIDPDGNDWYMTSNDDISTPVYFEGHDEHDGYTNIGESVLAMSEDGVQRSFNSDGTVTESVMLNDVVVESKYNNYRKGTFSYNESYLDYVPYEGVGINGSTSVRGFAKVYEMNGNMRAFVSADAFAPIENMGDVVYSGNVSIDVNGKTINSVGLRPATGSYFSQTGRTLVGVNDFALPQTDGDVTLKFNVMYTFSDGTGHIPSRVFEHKLQVGFSKP
ncbi:MAG: RHS repeat-associated core domain-containing protein [Bacteroidales bacterium]|nr:RHS repeat-associated core domain-containing protein [Bacteroidales bacterium]